MISLVGFADGSGRVLAVKDYRGEVSMERVREFCDDVFRTGDAADTPPVVQMGDVNFVFTKSKEVYAFAASRWDVNCSLALEFLEQIVEVLKSYSQYNEVKADKIRERLTLVLSILDEAMDFGYPQMLEADILKQYVFEKSIPTDDRKKEKLRERQMRAAAAATGAVPWRKTGLVYRRNEVYLDCIEKVSALLSPSGEILSGEVAGVVKMNCLLSGMPECRIGLNDKLSPDGSTSPGLASPSLQSAMGNRTMGRQVQLDSLRFHQAVRLRNYEEDKEICFIPPDGEFDLLHYTQTSHIDTPFRVMPIYTQQGRTRGEYQVTIRAMFPRELSAFKVVLLLPVPSTTAKAAPHTSHGKAKLKLSDGYIRWKIPEMTGEDEYRLTSSVDMVSTVEEKPWEKPPIRMQFQIPMYTASGVRVRFLRVTEQSNYVPHKWVRYMTLAGDYHIRIR